MLVFSWNQPVLSNEGYVSNSRKPQESLMGSELGTERITSLTYSVTPPLIVFLPWG